MGMFDELRCEYPLPDGFDPHGERFQTKDTPEQYLDLYVLTSEGTLRHEASGACIPYHGALTFYATNITGAGPKGVITKDDTPPWWAEYVALFDHGQLLKLEGSKQPATDRPWVTRDAFFGKE